MAQPLPPWRHDQREHEPARMHWYSDMKRERSTERATECNEMERPPTPLMLLEYLLVLQKKQPGDGVNRPQAVLLSYILL